MGSNVVSFTVKRWKVVAWSLAWLGFGLLLASQVQHVGVMKASEFHGRTAIFGLMPPAMRQVSMAVLAALILSCGVGALRYLFDPTIARIGDEGLEVVTIFGMRRARWQNLTKIVEKTVYRRLLFILKFVKQPRGSGESKSIALPGKLFGVDQMAIIALVKERLAGAGGAVKPARRMVPAPGINRAATVVSGPVADARRAVFGRRAGPLA